MRLAVWSGPRNLSTAMMYAFGCRPDFDAIDEPFYAAFLQQTGDAHPMGDQVLSAHETDLDQVVQNVSKQGKSHLYLKLIAHHMLPEFPLDWADGCAHIHLIRHPARVIASYTAKRPEMTLEDLGFPQQVVLANRFPGLVLDSETIRNDPSDALRRICDHSGISFNPEMIRWPQGPKPFDGIWASHWYNAVHASTGFAGPEGPLPTLSGTAAELLREALPLYEMLRSQA